MSAPLREIRFLDADGTRLRTAVANAGTGLPLLLSTGIGASLDLAEPFERELNTRGLHTISYDAPGVGESAPYAWPRRMGGVARTAERLLDALGCGMVDVFGVSLGGVVAIHTPPDHARIRSPAVLDRRVDQRAVAAPTPPAHAGAGR